MSAPGEPDLAAISRLHATLCNEVERLAVENGRLREAATDEPDSAPSPAEPVRQTDGRWGLDIDAAWLRDMADAGNLTEKQSADLCYIARRLVAIADHVQKLPSAAALAPRPATGECDVELREKARRYDRLPNCPDCNGDGGFGRGGFDQNYEWQGEMCERCQGLGKELAAAPPAGLNDKPWEKILPEFPEMLRKAQMEDAANRQAQASAWVSDDGLRAAVKEAEEMLNSWLDNAYHWSDRPTHAGELLRVHRILRAALARAGRGEAT